MYERFAYRKKIPVYSNLVVQESERNKKFVNAVINIAHTYERFAHRKTTITKTTKT